MDRLSLRGPAVVMPLRQFFHSFGKFGVDFTLTYKRSGERVTFIQQQRGPFQALRRMAGARFRAEGSKERRSLVFYRREIIAGLFISSPPVYPKTHGYKVISVRTPSPGRLYPPQPQPEPPPPPLLYFQTAGYIVTVAPPLRIMPYMLTFSSFLLEILSTPANQLRVSLTFLLSARFIVQKSRSPTVEER